MNTLLFFALPVATIILAIVFERIIDSPILVGLTAFAIFLIVTFAFFDESFLIFAIVYTILAYLAAVLSDYISRLINNNQNSCNCNNECSCNRNNIEGDNCNNLNSRNYNSISSDNSNNTNSCNSNINGFDNDDGMNYLRYKNRRYRM